VTVGELIQALSGIQSTTTVVVNVFDSERAEITARNIADVVPDATYFKPPAASYGYAREGIPSRRQRQNSNAVDCVILEVAL
jgi:hypothetical protein